MKKAVFEYLICPSCLPAEHKLFASVIKESDLEIISGHLTCRNCNRRYPVNEGLAVLLPSSGERIERGPAYYEGPEIISMYLWSQYADTFGDPEANDIYSIFSRLLPDLGPADLALDFGCSVGRITFELARKSGFCIGLDSSTSFIRAARQLAADGEINVTLKTEGNLREEKMIALPGEWDREKVEFIVGDVLAPPFPRALFSQVTSLNLLDKVGDPLEHLRQVNRVAKKSEAWFLFADPFSWSEEYSPQEAWLGGRTEGAFVGRGFDNVRDLLIDEAGTIQPAWSIQQAGRLPWKIRSHSNHYEMIFSEFFLAWR
ncbi:MAG: methyltransferase domain-containing protein [Deltaproteobacteria bacterium]|nr:methyltransferase domain-containing protein [Deltaproteobacteria bacterium]